MTTKTTKTTSKKPSIKNASKPVEPKPVETKKVEEKKPEPKKGLDVNGLVSLAKDAGLTVEENSGFYKIVGKSPSIRMYIAKRGSRIDLAGFCVKTPGITELSEAEAKAKRLGKVRGQLLNADQNVAVKAVSEAIKFMLSASAILVAIGRLGF
ncbi:hypothetical protein [Anaeromyxobacter sp. PSR-1]|uniref:hypothetical protein n=1 Tax=Anaeromyxobacter sp. PSR-1 TaxID=1300915 RepID=UPI0005DDD22B|nr:hypothetical protein [Anaeromyxobacter sp. PSR-1]GAO01914.1 hypothetical protein PSR1_00777 [Anaeromyxobacter sp. PSR-1]